MANHKLRIAVGKDVIINHDNDGNYHCAKCDQYFASPLQASRKPCKE